MLVGGHTLHDRADNFMSGDRILPIGVELLRTHRGSGMMPGSLFRLDRGKLQYPCVDSLAGLLFWNSAIVLLLGGSEYLSFTLDPLGRLWSSI